MHVIEFTVYGPNGEAIEQRTSSDVVLGWHRVCHNTLIWGEKRIREMRIEAPLLKLPYTDELRAGRRKPSWKLSPLERALQGRNHGRER